MSPHTLNTTCRAPTCLPSQPTKMGFRSLAAREPEMWRNVIGSREESFAERLLQTFGSLHTNGISLSKNQSRVGQNFSGRRSWIRSSIFNKGAQLKCKNILSDCRNSTPSQHNGNTVVFIWKIGNPNKKLEAFEKAKKTSCSSNFADYILNVESIKHATLLDIKVLSNVTEQDTPPKQFWQTREQLQLAPSSRWVCVNCNGVKKDETLNAFAVG